MPSWQRVLNRHRTRKILPARNSNSSMWEIRMTASINVFYQLAPILAKDNTAARKWSHQDSPTTKKWASSRRRWPKMKNLAQSGFRSRNTHMSRTTNVPTNWPSSKPMTFTYSDSFSKLDLLSAEDSQITQQRKFYKDWTKLSEEASSTKYNSNGLMTPGKPSCSRTWAIVSKMNILILCISLPTQIATSWSKIWKKGQLKFTRLWKTRLKMGYIEIWKWKIENFNLN